MLLPWFSLLTPYSEDSAWVMCEAGATWVLGKKIIPATRYVDVTKFPEPISMHQARVVESAGETNALIQELIGLIGIKPQT